MPKLSIKTMDTEGLIALRGEIDGILVDRRRDLEKQLHRLSRMGAGNSDTKPVASAGRVHPMAGRKVAPKYRDPKNPQNQWAGRGAQPRWLTAALKGGAKVHDFLIDKSGAKTGRKVGRPRRK